MGLKEVEKQSQSFLAIPSEAVGGSGEEEKNQNQCKVKPRKIKYSF